MRRCHPAKFLFVCLDSIAYLSQEFMRVWLRALGSLKLVLNVAPVSLCHS